MQGAERQEDRGEGEDGPSGVSSVEVVSGSSPFSYSPALQMIKYIQLCTHTRSDM